MTKQKRYESEAEIISAIDECSKQMKISEQSGLLHRKMADKHTKDSARHKGGDAAVLLERADEELKKSAFMIRRASRISEKLKGLKLALAAFRTVRFPFDADQSVVVDQ
jgi:hypothetical protein